LNSLINDNVYEQLPAPPLPQQQEQQQMRIDFLAWRHRGGTGGKLAIQI
jgi:hypothetical protein